jgi:hypothetical protein
VTLTRVRDNKVNVALYDYDAFARRLRKFRGDEVSADWLTTMKFVHQRFGADYLFGPVMAAKPGKGKRYIANQFVALEIEDGEPGQLVIISGDADPLTSTAWTRSFHTGKALTGKTTHALRWASQPYLDGWATDGPQTP